MRTTSLGLRLLWVVYVIKTWLLHKFHMLIFYNLITMKKTSCYYKKTCKSKINLEIIIFYKHIAILGFLRSQITMQGQRNHISHFCIYKLFINHLSSIKQVKSVPHSYCIQWAWNFRTSKIRKLYTTFVFNIST